MLRDLLKLDLRQVVFCFQRIVDFEGAFNWLNRLNEYAPFTERVSSVLNLNTTQSLTTQPSFVHKWTERIHTLFLESLSKFVGTHILTNKNICSFIWLLLKDLAFNKSVEWMIQWII